jgi:hypothetical protein
LSTAGAVTIRRLSMSSTRRRRAARWTTRTPGPKRTPFRVTSCTWMRCARRCGPHGWLTSAPGSGSGASIRTRVGCRGRRGSHAAKPGRSPGAEVAVGFDGSYLGVATAIVAVEMGDVPHLDVVRLWERPLHAGADRRRRGRATRPLQTVEGANHRRRPVPLGAIAATARRRRTDDRGIPAITPADDSGDATVR